MGFGRFCSYFADIQDFVTLLAICPSASVILQNAENNGSLAGDEGANLVTYNLTRVLKAGGGVRITNHGNKILNFMFIKYFHVYGKKYS